MVTQLRANYKLQIPVQVTKVYMSVNAQIEWCERQANWS